MTRVKLICRFFLFLLLLLISPLSHAMQADDRVSAEPAAGNVTWYEHDASGRPLIHLYFFWSKKCPHCLKARPDIVEIDAQYPWLKLHSLELVDHPENVQRYIHMAGLLGSDASSVPAFMFCGNMLTGYGERETSGQLLRDYLQACYDFAADNGADNSLIFPLDQQATTSLEVPYLGRVSADAYSLPVMTVLIAGMDAFNPCAFFVLLFLLSMMVHSRSRSRMALIGAIFVFFSGAIYFLFMAAWLNLFIFLGELRVITLVAGFVAAVIALINIKDYFWFKRGLSLSIADDNKPKLFDRIRGLLRLDSVVTVIFATIILAVVANSYELLCTAGFPMVYTRILTLKSLPAESYYLYLLFYNLIYILPLLTIVILFTVKLGARKLSVHEGMVLKLLSGVMMLMLACLLILSPQLLNNIAAATMIVITAITVTWLIVKLTGKTRSS